VRHDVALPAGTGPPGSNGRAAHVGAARGRGTCTEAERRRMMNKLELVTAVAEKAGITKRDAERAVNALVESIEDALKSGDKVSLVGFGTFEVRNRRPRVGRNPQTGQEIRIPAGRVPSFKAGKALKELIS
jgi:DNA-binding protein HU-beta